MFEAQRDESDSPALIVKEPTNGMFSMDDNTELSENCMGMFKKDGMGWFDVACDKRSFHGQKFLPLCQNAAGMK